MRQPPRLEVLVPPSSVSRVARSLRTVRGATVCARPTPGWSRRRLCLAPASAFERLDADPVRWLRELRDEIGEVPFVLLWHAGRGHAGDFRTVQRMAHATAGRRWTPYVAPDADAVRRIVAAQARGSDARSIASAELEGDVLVVWSCEPRAYRIPLAAIPALASLPVAARPRFEVSSSGSRLHWDAGDVDLDLPSLRAAIDPGLRRAQREQLRRESERYGRAIRSLRQELGLPQAAIAGVTERNLRRIEHGSVLPRHRTLERLAAAHRLTLPAYLAELARRP